MECSLSKFDNNDEMSNPVLILVLMECSLSVFTANFTTDSEGLNPCFNGMLSEYPLDCNLCNLLGLNPCFNGMLSERQSRIS